MSATLHRRHTLLSDNSRPAWAASYSVVVYEPGAIVSGNVTGQTFVPTYSNSPTPRASNKILLGTDTSTYRSVMQSSASGILVSSPVTATDGTRIVDLGSDTGGVSPSYDGSPLTVYSDPERVSIANNSTLTTSSTGEYEYWVEAASVLEVVRTSSGSLVELITVEGSYQPNVFSALDFSSVGDGSTDNSLAFDTLSRAINAIPITDGRDAVTVVFPQGHYVYSSGLDFQRPVRVKGDPGAILEYTGTGYAMRLGPAGVTVFTYQNHRAYSVDGVNFKGGANFIHGIYVSDFIVNPQIRNCDFSDFGNSSGYAMFFQSSNWDIIVENCRNLDSNVTNRINLLRVNGRSAAGTFDNGQSKLTMIDCAFNHINNVNTGIGVYINGVWSLVESTSIGGYRPNMIIGPWGRGTRIVNSYFEVTDPLASGCIEYGDEPGGSLESNYMDGLLIENCYANLHGDLTSGVLLAPRNSSTGLQYTRLLNTYVTNIVSGLTIVRQNNNGSQIHNVAYGNTMTLQGQSAPTTPCIHTTGGSIAEWEGDQGVAFFENNNDGNSYHIFRGGRTAKQNVGIELRDHTNTSTARYYVSPGSLLNIEAAGVSAAQFDTAGRTNILKSLALLTTNVTITGTPQAIDTTSRSSINLLCNNGGSNYVTLSAPAVNDQILVLRCSGLAAGTFTISGVGIQHLSSNWTPNSADTLTLFSDDSEWFEITRSSNG